MSFHLSSVLKLNGPLQIMLLLVCAECTKL